MVSGSDEHYEAKDGVVSGECDGGHCLARVSWNRFSAEVVFEGSPVMTRPEGQKQSVPSGHLNHVCL